MIHNTESLSKLAPFQSPLRPTLITLNSKKFAIFTGDNGGWFQVDETVTYEIIQGLWSPMVLEVQEPANINSTKNKVKTWKVPSSKGDKFYTITLREGNWNCDCLAWGFRKKCKHVQTAKDTLK